MIFSPGATEVGLDAAISGGAATGEVAHTVGVRLVPMGRADRDHLFGVAGVGDADASIPFASHP